LGSDGKVFLLNLGSGAAERTDLASEGAN
jgi:hypothetical protein